MRKKYEAPDLTIVKYSLMDVLVVSPTEDPIGDVIDPGDPDEPIDLDD